MRLIDADALIKDINACISIYDRNFEYGAVSGLVDALEYIKEAQTVDAVEVIRCKDCKYGKYDIADRGMYCSRNCVVLDTYESDYCSYAERRHE